MASIWAQSPGYPMKKLEGNLPANPDIMKAKLRAWADKLAKLNRAVTTITEEFEIELMWKDGVRFRVWVEFLSPPSKAEKHEPRPERASK